MTTEHTLFNPAPAAITARTVFHVGVSGGKDSAAALIWLVKESGIDPAKIDASFSDTGNEHDWTYEHIKLLSDRVHPIKTLHPERSYFDLALHKQRFPGVMSRFCTQELKIYPSQDHIGTLIVAGKDPIAVSGVRADESIDRRDLPEWDYSGTLLCMSWRPLLRWSLDDVVALHKRHNIPLNPLYAAGARRVGCWPCIMSRKAEIRNIALRWPERIEQIRNAENMIETVNGRFSSFFPRDKVPMRFRSKPYVDKNGDTIMVCTIDDVVQWSLTGKNAKGSWDDEGETSDLEPISCNSGFCE